MDCKITVTLNNKKLCCHSLHDPSCHLRSLETTRWVGRKFLSADFCNYDPIFYHFWDIQHRIMACLEFWVRGDSRSLKVAPVDRSHERSYLRSLDHFLDKDRLLSKFVTLSHPSCTQCPITWSPLEYCHNGIQKTEQNTGRQIVIKFQGNSFQYNTCTW